jgi:hypothetical protein
MSAFSAINGDLARLDGALSRRGMGTIGVGTEALVLKTKRGKNGGSVLNFDIGDAQTG